MDGRQQQEQQQQQQMNSGLMRYRSAPSTLIASFMENQEVGESEGCDDFIPSHHPPPLPPPPPRSSSPEAEIMFARFMTNCGDSASPPDLGEMEEKFTSNRNCQYMNPNLEHGSSESTTKYSQIMYQTQQPVAAMPETYRGVSNSVATQNRVKISPAPAPPHSNLIRHSSSPAGLFSHLSVENGYAVMRGIGNSRAGNGSNGEVAASASRLKGQISYSPGPPSSSGLISQISEIESDSMGATSEADGGSLSNSNANNRYITNFPLASWDDSALENFSRLKRARDGNNKMMSGLNSTEPQNGEPGNPTPSLSHHYSLPKNSAEMAAILQFQDSVPCKIRAKRGCATHPRSIAERVRRTRISERMRKLQELVPNMDKQTNTADMLDLAVEYIKDLQKQVKTLNDNRANCTCSSKQKPYQNSRV